MEKNIALKISYDGSCFHGWQYQQNAFSVQEAICEGWLELTQEKINLIGCSRTDTGVHAKALIANFKTNTKIPAEKIHIALNPLLREGVSVQAALEVNPNFNSRVDAIGKHYSYYYYLNSAKPALFRNFVAHIVSVLDVDKMQEACKFFIGERDFVALMDQGSPVKSTQREIIHLQVESISEKIIRMDIVGTGFLYHMVRIIAGTLLYVGEGKIKVEAIAPLLATKDRTLMGKTMPSQGLFLNKVYYKKELFGEDGLVEFKNWSNPANK